MDAVAKLLRVGVDPGRPIACPWQGPAPGAGTVPVPDALAGKYDLTTFNYPLVRATTRALRPPSPEGVCACAAEGRGEWVWTGPEGTVRPDPASADALLVYVHGGGFVYGSPQSSRQQVGETVSAVREALGRLGRTDTDTDTDTAQTGGAGNGETDTVPGPVVMALSVRYRLAPEHPAPAGLEDVEAAVRWAVKECGVDAGRIVLSGDSAGGNLAVAAGMRLAEKEDIRVGCIYSKSPWAEFTRARPSYVENADKDFILVEPMMENARIYLQSRRVDDPDLSLTHAEASRFAASPPIIVQAGGAEVFRDSITAFAEAAAAGGATVHCSVWEDMPHVFHGFFGKQSEATAAVWYSGQQIAAVLTGAGLEAGNVTFPAGIAWSGDTNELVYPTTDETGNGRRV